MGSWIAPIARVKIADDVFMAGDGYLRSVSVTLSEDARASRCKFELYDPGMEFAAQYFEMSFRDGGIQVPADLLEDPNKAKSGGGTISIPGAAGLGGASVEISGLSSVQKKNVGAIVQEGRARGLDNSQIAAIVAGAMQESQLGTLNDEVGGYGGKGLFQLTDAAGQTGTWIGKGGIKSVQDYYDPNKNVKAIMEDYQFEAWKQRSKGMSPEQAATSFASMVLRPYEVGDKYADKARKLFPGGNVSALDGGSTPTPPQQAVAQQAVAATPPPVKDASVTKPVEVSKKGTEIIVELGYQIPQLVNFHFIHTGTTTQGRSPDSTGFEGQSIRWLMTRRTKNTAYANITLRELAEKVCAAYGFKLDMEGDGPKYDHLDQTGITDYELLLRECRGIGYSIRENKDTLILKPYRPEFTGFVITADILLSISFADKASKDMQGAPSAPASDSATPSGDSKFAIDRVTGVAKQVKLEDSTGTGKALANASAAQIDLSKVTIGPTVKASPALAASNPVAVTGSPVKKIGGTPAPESAAKPAEGATPASTGDAVTGLPKQEIGAIDLADGKAEASAIADESKRVKGYESSATVLTTDAVLAIAPGSIIGLSRNIVPETFATEWRVGQVTHTLSQGKMTTTLNFYKPQKQKAASSGGISIAGSEVLGGNVPAGKMQNPMPGTPRGTPFDPAGVIRGRKHLGIDMSGGSGNKILAAESGKVTDTENSCVVGDRKCGGGYGNLVVIQHEGEWAGYETWYCHLKTGTVTVQTGQAVKKGQVIGVEGDTGSSGGDHLHFEVRKGGQAIDPEPLFCPPPTGVYGQGEGTPLRSKC
jgi:murein DD-endopeptidase MepM/ murein hydrolase activator NlpD